MTDLSHFIVLLVCFYSRKYLVTAFWNRWTLDLCFGPGNAGLWTEISGNLGPKTHKICCIHVLILDLCVLRPRPRQSSPKVERTLVRICMEKEGAFQFEAWSMDSNKKGVFERESPWISKKRGYFYNVLSRIVNLNFNHVVLVGGKSCLTL